MGRHLWAKVRVDMRHHPKLIGRPDADFRLWASLILHAKEHCPDGIVRGLSPSDMRGAWGIKAPAENVRRALAYFEKEKMLIRQGDDGLLIKDFVDEQRSRKDSPDAVAERMRDYRKRKKEPSAAGSVTADVTGPPTRNSTRDESVTRYAEGEGEREEDLDQEISKRSGEEIPSRARVDERAAGAPSLGWDPVLLARLRIALRKSEIDDDFRSFLGASARFQKDQREAATVEFLDRGCAEDGKGTAYLLTMIKGGAGGKRKPPDPDQATRPTDHLEATQRMLAARRANEEQAIRERDEAKAKGVPSAAEKALEKVLGRRPNGAPRR